MLTVLILTALIGNSELNAAQISATRLPLESHQDAARREGLSPSLRPAQSKEAPVLDVAEAYLDFDPSDVPLWDASATAETLQSAFELIRDAREYIDEEHPDFLRRIAWLYPDDGCYVRASLFNQKLEALGLPRGWKIFAFGDIRIPTPNHPSGEVLWWFHVAPIFRLKEGLYVADPSLFPDRPIKLKEWLRSLAPDHDLMNLRMVTCDPFSFNPGSRCIGGTKGMDGGAIRQHPEFLYNEWERQVRLGRDPKEVLGDEPPWKPNR